MRTYILYAVLLALLVMVFAPLSAQEPPSAEPVPGTSTLPNDPGAATDAGTPDESTSVTPPAPPTPSLPAQAKRGSLMVKAGDKELEWRLSYSHFSSNTVFVDGVAMLPVLVIGKIGVERVRKDILIASLAARFGLRDNIQGEIKVPYRYEHDVHIVPEGQTTQESESVISGSGLGDIEGNLYIQLPQHNPRSIRWIASVGVKAATGSDIFSINPDTETPIGTGFWSSKFSLTGVVISDPAAIFWNLGYTYNWKRMNIRVVPKDAQTGEDLTPVYVDVKPGNTIDFGGGVAYALNPRLSMNTGVSFSINGSTTSNDIKLANTAITSASLRMGMIWLRSNNQPIDIAVSIGLTEDSPDYTLELRQNWKF